MKKFLFNSLRVLAFAALLVSCASAPSRRAAEDTLLPLAPGWYIYNFERTFKGIEDEYDFAVNYGMKMVQEITVKQGGTITYFEDGVMYDPALKIGLSIDDRGGIRSLENPGILGTLGRDGYFFWSGTLEQNGRLNTVYVKGTLKKILRSDRGGSEFDGLYHMTDTGSGREQLVRISDGFYTWRYLEESEDPGFTPWPTLVQPDGSFSFSMEFTTKLEMGELSRANYSTVFAAEGRITPGKGISMEEVSRTAGMGNDSSDTTPQVYAGVMIRGNIYPNEEIPEDINKTIRSVVQSAKAVKTDWSKYPSWYLNLPAKANFIYAAGEKTFPVKETAFAMAETAAAANIAESLRVRIESVQRETANNRGERIEELMKSEALERIPYTIIERVYNTESSTAFVLAELDLNELKK
jgi:hypothetical protein